MTFKEARNAGIDVDHKTYRNAYQRWKCALKRGHKDVKLETYLKEKRVQLCKGKPRRSYAIKRQLEIARAMPKWVNIEEIVEFYMNRPEGKHVDHIIPINGENVSGLHVLHNLQYLEPYENYRKGNRVNKRRLIVDFCSKFGHQKT